MFDDFKDAKDHVDMDRKKYPYGKKSVVIKKGDRYEVWSEPVTGIETGERVYELGGGLPSGASQSYMITESLGNPAQHFEVGGDFQSGVYAKGGSLQAHGIEVGDTFIKTISGGIQKVKDKNGKIVYINLSNGERDSQPPLPFNKGGAVTTEIKYVNKGEDYEVRYAKPRPKRKGYKGVRKFDDGGVQDGIEEDIDMTDDKVLRVRKPAMPKKKLSNLELAEKHNSSAYEFMGKDKIATGGETKKDGKGGIMVLAKKIRKEGESWQDALKRAGQQLK
jgi:hypothetical protein